MCYDEKRGKCSYFWGDDALKLMQEEVPVVNFGAMNIVRCRRCRTYINAYVTFTEGGRRWKCNVCVLFNEGAVEMLQGSWQGSLEMSFGVGF